MATFRGGGDDEFVSSVSVHVPHYYILDADLPPTLMPEKSDAHTEGEGQHERGTERVNEENTYI